MDYPVCKNANCPGGLQESLKSYWGLQKIFFLSRSSSDTLSWSILHKDER